MSGAATSTVLEPRTGQAVLVAEGATGEITIRYHYAAGGAYPAGLFAPHTSRFTRIAEGLAAEAQSFDGATVEEIASHVAALFTYGHPEERYYDGFDELPHLCDMAVGSCVDINFYFIAMLRAAGIEAGYVTGAFFPAEKRDWCNDMHCWVVIREGDLLREWDIAHHLKLGQKTVAAGLNPKPGFRLPVSYGMGLDLPALDLRDIKLMSEPMWLVEGALSDAEPQIKLTGGPQ
ncbi:MAG: transglutaminase-like domain-containing protein [Pseudomonadota bacterium]